MMNSDNHNEFATKIYVNNPVSNDQQMIDSQQVMDGLLYQNVREINDRSEITVNGCNTANNKNSSISPRIPPPIKPRLSLLSKKFKQEQLEAISCETLEQIDENLNLILKRQNEKLNEIVALANDLPSPKSYKVTKKGSQESEVIYLNNEELKIKTETDQQQQSDEFSSDEDEDYEESSPETNDQLSPTDRLLSQISALNRNTYISHAELNEEMIRQFNLNDRFSNNYNELEEPIYSDIIFEERCNSIYDVPSLTDSIRFIRPPPLPPRPTHTIKITEEIEKDSKTEEENDKLKNVQTTEQIKNHHNGIDIRNMIKTELAKELKNFHLKSAEHKSSQNSMNSSSLNNLQNDAPSRSNQMNPFINQSNSNSDLKLNEFKESLNELRKDHFISLSESNSLNRDVPVLKNKLNNDELMMFERCFDDSMSSTFPKPNRPTLQRMNNIEHQGYGKINKIDTSKDQLSDDEGSLKSSFSLMDSQLNSSSNETFSYKSVKSYNSNKSFNHPNKLIKPNVGVIAPFIRSSPSNTSSPARTDLEKTNGKATGAQLHFDQPNNLDKQKNLLTVQLTNELKSTLNGQESPMPSKKLNNPNKEDSMRPFFMPSDCASKSNEIGKKTNPSQNQKNKQILQVITNQQLVNQQLMNQHNQSDQEHTLNNEKIPNNIATATEDHNNIRDYLYKTGSSRRPPFNKRWCVLSESALFYYNEEKQNLSDLKSQASKGHVELNDILFISIIPGAVLYQTNRFMKAIKSKSNSIELYQFNIGIHSENGRVHLMASENVNSRQFWIDLISLRIRPKLKSTQHITWKNVDVCGYLNIKIGLTGLWTKCFAVLQQRTLNIQLLDVMGSERDGKKIDLITIDLRQVMSVGFNENVQIKPCTTAYESGPVFYLNRRFESQLYFQADYKSHSELWLGAIKLNWELPRENGGKFEDQLIAPNFVPIAIEKLINFISTYDGISTRQIYKAPGDETSIKEILDHLKSDSIFKWNILPEEGFTVLDVSNALKIYLKSFPECLLTEILYQDFLRLNFLTNHTERITKLKLLLERLPHVNYSTLKKLICHFMLFIENSAENEMDLESMAQAISPWLIFSKISANPELTLSINLFKDLVDSYVWLFNLKQEEIDKERKIESSLKELRKLRVKQDEDKLLVAIYLFNKVWGKTCNVPINSTMTADDLLFYVVKMANLKESSEKLCVCEVVLNDQLERVIHYSERIQQITLDWTVRWSQQDASSNYLLIKPNTLYEELEDYFDKGMNSMPITLFTEVRFSEDGNKFRKVSLEFESTNSRKSKFNIFKDAKATKSLRTWTLEDVVLYLGHTGQQKAPSRFCITMLDRYEPIKRQKEVIKHKTISFNTGDELAKWLAIIMCCNHPEGIFPLIHLNE